MSFEEVAKNVVEEFSGQQVVSIERFATGMAHYVFDAVCADGREIVVRMAHPDAPPTLAGAVYWSEKLRPRGVPLPEILAYDLTRKKYEYQYLLLERLPGQDLGPVYPTLTVDEKRQLAREIARIQNIVQTLPQASGYGYALNDDQPLSSSWYELIMWEMEKSRPRIESAGVFETKVVDRVTEALAHFEDYLTSVPPKPFLDDTTTKNVIMHEGKLSGIVDVDVVCFGDPLFVLALTNMALLSREYTTDYIEFWAEEWKLDEKQRQVLRLYTALFCVIFMGEIGQKFNRDEPVPAEPARDALYKRLLDELLAGLD